MNEPLKNLVWFNNIKYEINAVTAAAVSTVAKIWTMTVDGSKFLNWSILQQNNA